MSRIFFSLTAFSLALSQYASAEEAPTEQEFVEQTFDAEVAQEETMQEEAAIAQEEAPAPKQRSIFPSKNPPREENLVAEAPAAQPPKLRAHFAGARRAPPKKPKVEDSAKKPKRVRNEWFKSKTQPKAEKKSDSRDKQDPIPAPEERPYFVKGNFLADAGSDPLMAMRPQGASQQEACEESEGQLYPRTGFQAPEGRAYFTGEWLYWRTRQAGMEYATAKEICFDFDTGFRVGVGVNFPYFDGWDVYANYTYFNPEHSDSANGAIYPLFLFQGAPGGGGNAVASAEGTWNIRLQSLDIEFGKAYYISETLSLRPFFGMKGTWINQHAHFRYQGGYIPEGQTFRTHFENDFKGGGPFIGTDGYWHLGGGFSFFADLAAALLVGHFDNDQRQFQLGGVEVVHLDSDFNLVSPFLQMLAGISWDRNFSRDRRHLGLSAGFETQYYWNQNQTEQFTDDVRPAYVRQRGDLAFYGLTLRARFDF